MNHKFCGQDFEVRIQSWWHSPLMFWCFCMFYFHWIIWFLFRCELDTPSFIDKIIERHFLVWCRFVIKAIHPYGKYSVCCLLLMCDGATRTNLQQLTEFGLWQDPSAKSSILVDFFWWGCLVWIVADAFDYSQPFPNVVNGQKVWWPCLV